MLNILSKLLGKKQEPAIDLSRIKTDMHSHLIPGIDDGAKTIEESIEMVQALKGLGFSKLYTTPHIMSDFYNNSPATIKEGVETLRKKLAEEKIPIQIDAAAEYYLDYEFEQLLDNGDILTFGDNYLLFEISMLNPPENLENIIFLMQTKGYKPVLAHPERYTFWFNDFERFRKLKEKWVYFQLNLGSLVGHYSIPVMKTARKMIDAEMIDFVGTDMHHMRHLPIYEKCLNDKYLKKLVNSGLLLNDRI